MVILTTLFFIFFVSNFYQFKRAITSINDFFERTKIKLCEINNTYHQIFIVNYSK
jgi:hypothetical protein